MKLDKICQIFEKESNFGRNYQINQKIDIFWRQIQILAINDKIWQKMPKFGNSHFFTVHYLLIVNSLLNC